MFLKLLQMIHSYDTTNYLFGVLYAHPGIVWTNLVAYML